MFDKILKPIFELFQTGEYPTLDEDEKNVFNQKLSGMLRLVLTTQLF